MEVVEGCSGVQFLISVIALGIPLVYLTQKTWKRGIIVIAFSVAISIPTNGARVALAGIMGHYYGSGSFHGPFHILQGLFVSYVGLIALFVVNWLVCKIPSQIETKLYNRWKVRPQESIDPPKETSRRYPFPLVLILLIGIGIYVHLYGSPRPVPPKRALVEFPLSIDDWEGRDSAWLRGDGYFPGVDNGLTRTYRNASGREINLYIGYFASQRQGKSLISYHANPLRRGIHQVSSGFVDSQQGPGQRPGPQTVNLSFPVIDQTFYAAVFWYRFPSGELTQRVQTKLKGITDAVIHRRNNGAVILLAARPANKGEEESVTNDLLTFARILAPTLREYLP
jgi:EpsI family protein